MGFTWLQDISVGASIDAADINELKNNLDWLYSARSLTYPGCASGAGWNLLPVSAGAPISSAQIVEVRSRVDYAYEQNCSTVYNAPHLSADDLDVYSLNRDGYDGSDEVTYYPGNYPSAKTTELTGFCPNLHSADEDGYYHPNWSTYDSNFKTSNNPSYYTTEDGSDEATYYTGAKSGVYGSVT